MGYTEQWTVCSSGELDVLYLRRSSSNPDTFLKFFSVQRNNKSFFPFILYCTVLIIWPYVGFEPVLLCGQLARCVHCTVIELFALQYMQLNVRVFLAKTTCIFFKSLSVFTVGSTVYSKVIIIHNNIRNKRHPLLALHYTSQCNDNISTIDAIYYIIWHCSLALKGSWEDSSLWLWLVGTKHIKPIRGLGYWAQKGLIKASSWLSSNSIARILWHY